MGEAAEIEQDSDSDDLPALEPYNSEDEFYGMPPLVPHDHDVLMVGQWVDDRIVASLSDALVVSTLRPAPERYTGVQERVRRRVSQTHQSWRTAALFSDAWTTPLSSDAWRQAMLFELGVLSADSVEPLPELEEDTSTVDSTDRESH